MPIDAKRVQSVFLAASEIADPAERARFLDGACDGDTGLKARVEALLRAEDQPDSLLDHPAVPPHDPNSAATQTIGHEGGAATDDEVSLGFLAPATRPDSLGRIGHYEVLQVLGEGGFGIVFRAFDDVLERVVAVKVLAPQMAATSPARKRFLREARSSAQVRHENVVQVYEVGEHPLPYIAMEFIPGETLQQRLDRTGPIDVAEVVRIGRQIAEGLAAAHATDLIHRDIKPGNVLLEGGQLRVKLTDFGLARAADDASISRSGLIAGTPLYMAPEQAKGETFDQRADLFSLGSVLYVMAAGRPPFRANGTLAVLKRVAEDTPRPIREVIPETPQWLCDIIAQLHAKDPAERYQSAREVADVLADCEAQLKANAKLKDFSRIPRGKPRRSSRRKWIAAAAVLLLPLIALAVTEFAGVTHLFRAQEVTHNPDNLGGEPPAVSVAKPEGLPPTYKNTIGMEFVKVPKGKSWLGGSKDKLGDREVEVLADFYLGKYEVTQEHWEKVMGYNPSAFSRKGGYKDAVKDISDADLKRFPVEAVSWDQCQIFVAKLNRLENEPGWDYRLPTEEEWEYACRGGPMADKRDSTFDFYFAKPTNTLLPAQANYNNGLHRPGKVGSYEPNVLGLYDMHGNVAEWCNNPSWVESGGSWGHPASDCRAESRSGVIDGLASGGLRVARVRIGAPAPEVKTPSTDPDRRAAEFVLYSGGMVKVNDLVQEINAKTDLPREPFRLTSVDLGPGVPDDGLASFKGCTNLVHLSLRVNNIDGVGTVTDEGLAYFKDCKNLISLSVNSSGVTGAGLLHFKECKNLTILSLNSSGITDAGLAPVKGFKNLTHLDLSNTGITDAGLVHFEGYTKLTHLRLGRLVTDAGLVHFKDCKNLIDLDMNSTGVTDAGLVHFKDCKNLLNLDLGDTQVGDAGIAAFKDCKNLEKLTLRNTQVGNVGLAQLKDCKGLRVLDLGRSKVTDAGLASLKNFKSLTSLVLWSTRLSDAGLADIAGLDNLTDLNLARTKVTARGIKGLAKVLPRCAITWEDGVNGPNNGPDRRAADRVLYMGGVVEIDPGGELKAPDKLPGSAFRLTRVDLGNNLDLTDTELGVFKECQNLNVLDLTDTLVTDAGLAHLARLSGLTDLLLAKSRVTAKGVEGLAKALPKCKITWDGGVIGPQ